MAKVSRELVFKKQEYNQILSKSDIYKLILAQVIQVMQRDQFRTYIEQESWLDCIGDLIHKNNTISNQIIQNDDPVFLQTSAIPFSYQDFQKNIQIETQSLDTKNIKSFSNKRLLSSDSSGQNICQQLLYKGKEEAKYFDQSSKQQSKQSQKQQICGKQSQYSKNYREKKKEQLRILQEENIYLKQKINELQCRLREKELQLNRLKHPPQEKELSVEQLNEEFIKKTNFLLSKTAVDPETYGKKSITPEDKFYAEFMKSYDEYGFGGFRKVNTLNYYFNELLESVMKDSQKYLFLICNNAEDPQLIKGLETYQQIDFAFQQIMQLDQDKSRRLEHFTINLHHFMVQLKHLCSDIGRDFNRIITFLGKVHNFMKSSYPQNMDFSRKRIQLQNWFQKNKHTKLIRRLRSHWLEFIKKPAQTQNDQKTNLKGCKKKRKPLGKEFP